jgi:hypothetical protein
VDNNKIIIGYKCTQESEHKLADILNRQHFNKYFSELIIDREKCKIYKEYLLRHNVLDDMENFMEYEFISNLLSMLEIGYKK